MWTVNDFPAYIDLSGWPNRGVKSCPYCMHLTRSRWLKHGKKYCFIGHKRYLPIEHLWRLNKRTFYETQELECAPNVQCRDEILRQLEGLAFGDENAGKKNGRSRRREN
jgi:hypothetical protein